MLIQNCTPGYVWPKVAPGFIPVPMLRGKPFINLSRKEFFVGTRSVLCFVTTKSKDPVLYKDLKELGVAYQDPKLLGPETLKWTNEATNLTVVASRGKPCQEKKTHLLTKNFVFGRYLCAIPNYVLLVDLTLLTDILKVDGKKKSNIPADTRQWCCLAVQDLASRAIVGYGLKPGRFTSQDVIETLDQIFDFLNFPERGSLILDRPERAKHYVHSDLGGEFTSQAYMSFLASRGVASSHAFAARFHNQVVERVLGTIKNYARQHLRLAPRNGNTPPFDGVAWPDMVLAVHAAVDRYNDEGTSATLGLTRTEMLEAYEQNRRELELLEISPDNTPFGGTLQVTGGSSNSEVKKVLCEVVTPILSRTDGGIQELIIRAYNTFVAHNYVRGQVEKQIEPVPRWSFAEAEERANELVSLLDCAVKRRDSLLLKTLETQLDKRDLRAHIRSRAISEQVGAGIAQTKAGQVKMLEELVKLREQADKQEERLQKKADRAAARKRAKKKEVRDPIELWHLEHLLINIVTGHTYCDRRRRASCLISFCLGLRASEVRCLTVRQVRDLVDNGFTHVTLCKGGSPHHQVFLSEFESERCLSYQADFNALKTNKLLEDFAFSPEEDFRRPMSKTGWIRDLNSNVLHPLGKFYGKNFSTHSFRIGKISRLHEAGIALESISALIGHRRLQTTAGYSRRVLNSPEQLKDINRRSDKYLMSRKPITREEIENCELAPRWNKKKRYGVGRPKGSRNKSKRAALLCRAKLERPFGAL